MRDKSHNIYEIVAIKIYWFLMDMDSAELVELKVITFYRPLLLSGMQYII